MLRGVELPKDTHPTRVALDRGGLRYSTRHCIQSGSE